MFLWLLACSRAQRDLSRSMRVAEDHVEGSVAVGNRTLIEVLGTELFRVGEDPVTLGSVMAVVVVLVMSWLISRLLQRAVTAALSRRGAIDEGRIGVTNRLMHYVIMLVGFSVAMESLGVRLSSLFAAGAIFAVGIGFAMQTIAQNFVAGVILLVERSIRPRDILQIDGQVVRVEEMGIRRTIVRTWNDEDLIVPNQQLSESNVKNFTSRDSQVRIGCTVGVSYKSDMTLVEQVLLDAARSVEGRVKDREPVALLLEFGNSSVNWRVHIWSASPWSQEKLRSDLNKAVWWGLKRAEITIPFPQLDVHFDGPPPPPDRLIG